MVDQSLPRGKTNNLDKWQGESPSPASVTHATGTPMKSLLRTRPALYLASHLLGCYLRLILRTNRWRLDGVENLAPHSAGSPAVFGFWHEHLPLMPALAMLARRSPAYHPAPIHALVSQHNDGQLIGAVIRQFGIESVLGSSTRGGANGLRQLLWLLRRGAMVGITPDGPRGPRRVAARGVAQLAALAAVPVLPCAVQTSRKLVLHTWDRMAIPLPFGRGIVVCGPAIRVSRDSWRETLPAITAAMNQAAERAEQLCTSG